ncbi:hypothetical protein SKAU_G00141220 [Synaphobranchus kaupii]|uniref:Uncharacterized protein n=1 Tax=Synaphobranchus kaupii TaxID=118154 RepID=A0A9Q1FSA4_SYNKA|nr:hypothetical protein SKAU_G00141220 [Synaphobranchus kaupii]
MGAGSRAEEPGCLQRSHSTGSVFGCADAELAPVATTVLFSVTRCSAKGRKERTNCAELRSWGKKEQDNKTKKEKARFQFS